MTELLRLPLQRVCMKCTAGAGLAGDQCMRAHVPVRIDGVDVRFPNDGLAVYCRDGEVSLPAPMS
jgi:hypothetical protein